MFSILGGGGGAVESSPEFLWRIVMKKTDFNIFSDKSARMFLIFPSVCPNFHGFPKSGGAVAPPLSRTPMCALMAGCNHRSKIF